MLKKTTKLLYFFIEKDDLWKNQEKENNDKNLWTKKKIKTSFFLGKRWKAYLKKINISQKKNWSTVRQEKKTVISLNKNLKSKLSPFFFKPWIKKKRVRLTERQLYLKKLYAQYRKKCSWRKRKDFLKTSFGEILKITHLNSEIKLGLWLSARVLLKYRKIKKLNKKKIYIKKIPWVLVKNHGKQYQLLIKSMQKGWLYESLLKKKNFEKSKTLSFGSPANGISKSL